MPASDMRPFVTSEPYLHEVVLTPQDEFIIIGCDGGMPLVLPRFCLVFFFSLKVFSFSPVWDVFTDEEAAAIVAGSPDPVAAAASLRDAAYDLRRLPRIRA